MNGPRPHYGLSPYARRTIATSSASDLLLMFLLPLRTWLPRLWQVKSQPQAETTMPPRFHQHGNTTNPARFDVTGMGILVAHGLLKSFLILDPDTSAERSGCFPSRACSVPQEPEQRLFRPVLALVVVSERNGIETADRSFANRFQGSRDPSARRRVSRSVTAGASPAVSGPG